MNISNTDLDWIGKQLARGENMLRMAILLIVVQLPVVVRHFLYIKYIFRKN